MYCNIIIYKRMFMLRSPFSYTFWFTFFFFHAILLLCVLCPCELQTTTHPSTPLASPFCLFVLKGVLLSLMADICRKKLPGNNMEGYNTTLCSPHLICCYPLLQPPNPRWLGESLWWHNGGSTMFCALIIWTNTYSRNLEEKRRWRGGWVGRGRKGRNDIGYACYPPAALPPFFSAWRIGLPSKQLLSHSA